MMPERYFRYRTTRPLDASEAAGEARSRAVKELGSVPPSRRRWRRTLRTGLFWTALGLGAASLSYACDPTVAARSLGFDRPQTMLFFVLVPIPALALGVRSLALALRLRAASDVADRAAEYLAEHLSESFVVVSHYGPRDGGEDDVPLVIIGPPGVLVVQPRECEGELACYQDNWYRTRAYGVGRRLRDASVSKLARWNAGRVRRDLAKSGFVRASVEGCVVFMGARLADVASSCVPVYESLDALVTQLESRPQLQSSPARMRALADALLGSARLALV